MDHIMCMDESNRVDGIFDPLVSDDIGSYFFVVFQIVTEVPPADGMGSVDLFL